MKLQPSWTQVTLAGLVLAAFLASYFLPPDVRAELRADLGYVWGVIAALLPALLSRKNKAPTGEKAD